MELYPYETLGPKVRALTDRECCSLLPSDSVTTSQEASGRPSRG